jgi:manganese transport protein
MQLPFALVPLLWFTTRRRCLGEHAFRRRTAALLWAAAGCVMSLNLWMLAKFVAEL